MHIPHEKMNERDSTGYQLTIVGGGRGEESVRKTIEASGLGDAIHLVGKLPPHELWPLMADHDIFVFPTLSEGFPNVLLEAMACGLPIVSSDFKGVRDIIQSEENGRIYAARDALHMAQTISGLVEEGSYRKIGENNREFVKRFTWDKYMALLEELLEQVTDGHGSVNERNPAEHVTDRGGTQ